MQSTPVKTTSKRKCDDQHNAAFLPL